uniref:Uncharacterized protein n=1 Tax=Chromera velia CCMP2878 TaxID=1169474 RepID=A0A0G4HNQ1_9ALVE|eukprot:Cvel_29563.t1-p1 / transcript=Cvel_29563.t1 / gene=Cvel_29563 / organism=Chromera_velia_CCMP2878 / gene_product=hypothetical protein / transcript_product=hypothetical protein / location=Cvel_scaffold4062:7162-9654(-) / protein_length=480 / sequence_SO=supercontig / SO=protein_coding / is_pseudo=false
MACVVCLASLYVQGRSLLPLATLDLSGFSLSARKLKVLLSSLPSVETLRCGPQVCKDACLPVLLDFLQRLKVGGAGGVPSIFLKTLKFAKCDLGEAAVVIFHHLPRSLEYLDLSGNRLRSVSMEGLGSVLSFAWLPSLLSLDLSDNPLGSSGVKTFARGLSSSPQSLPLQTLKLARTKAKAEGVQALAEALKAKKTTSLQTLDLAENEMRPAGLKHLASAVNAEAVPHLRVLVLKENELTKVTDQEKDCAPISELLTTNALKGLQEFDLSDNCLFDEGVGEIGGGGGGVQLSAATVAVPGRFPKLRRLDLGRVSPSIICSEQLAAFAGALGVGGLPSLEELVIPFGGSEQNPNPQGVVSLANALTSGHLSQLRGLTLPSRDDVTDEAFASLTRSLVTGKTSLLQTVNLEIRNINSAEGLGALAGGIRGGRFCALTSFRLCLGDHIPESGHALSSLGLAFGSGGCTAVHAEAPSEMAGGRG